MNIFIHGMGPSKVMREIWTHIFAYLKELDLNCSLVTIPHIGGNVDPQPSYPDRLKAIKHLLGHVEGSTVICTEGCLHYVTDAIWMNDVGLLGSNSFVFTIGPMNKILSRYLKKRGATRSLTHPRSAEDCAASVVKKFKEFHAALILAELKTEKRNRSRRGAHRPDEHRIKHIPVTIRS
jgi:hypothetical protein